MSHLPFTSLMNAGAPTDGGVLDLQAGLCRQLTMIVGVSGAPSSFSVNLEGAHDLSAGDSPWAVLATADSAGAVTVDTHWVRYVRASLISLSGGSTPLVSATLAAVRS